MSIYKKLVMHLVIAICIYIYPLTTFAVIFNEYGAYVLQDSFETISNSDLESFPYRAHLNGAHSGVFSISNQQSRSFDNSVKLDVSAMAMGDNAVFAHSFHLNTLSPRTERYYISFYLKGNNVNISDVSFYYRYDTEYGSSKNAPYLKSGVELPDQNGWRKFWYIVPKLPDYSIHGYIGLRYTKNNNNVSEIYIDDYSVATAPTAISFIDCSACATKPFDLSSVMAYAYGADGQSKRIVNTKMINWRVISGEAIVADGILLTNNNVEQSVVLEGEFLTETAILRITLINPNKGEPMITVNSISENEGIYQAVVKNEGDIFGSVTLIVALFDGNRLYKVYPISKNLSPGQTEVIVSQPLVIPDFINNPIIKAYVSNSLFGVTSYFNSDY